MSNPLESVIRARGGPGRRSQPGAAGARLVQGGARGTLADRPGVLAPPAQPRRNGAWPWVS